MQDFLTPIAWRVAGISAKMSQNNAFTVAKRTLEGQDMIYQSLKLSNGIWALVGKIYRYKNN